MDRWGVQILQLVIFRDRGDLFNAGSIFKTLTGKDAENTQTNQSLSPQAPYFSLASGIFDLVNWSVNIGPGRVDIQAGKPDEAPGTPSSFALDQAWQILASMRTNVAKLTFEAVTRLACNVHMMAPFPSAAAASKWVADRVTLAVPIENPLDLMLQINKTVPSSNVAAVTLNRLMRFSVTSFQSVGLVIQPGGLQTSLQQFLRPQDQHFANLLLDLNTVPNGRSFSSEEQKLLLRELGAIAERLGNDGTLKGLVSQ